EADPAPWASVAMRDRGRRVCGRVGDRFRDLRRLGGPDRDGLGLREICGRVPSAGIAPPSFVLPDPTQRGAAGRACELRLAQRRVCPAMVAVPPSVSSDIRELAAARRTRMERPRRLDGGSDGNSLLSFGPQANHGGLNGSRKGSGKGPVSGGSIWA